MCPKVPLTQARRLAAVLVAVATTAVAVLPTAAASQELSLEQYERWQLYSAPGPEPQTKSALLLLLVANRGDRLIKHWRALLVARDSLGQELFRLALDRDSADLEPGERAQIDIRFENDPSDPNEPYDLLLDNDTSNLRLTFDETVVVQAGRVVFLPSGTLVCFNEDVFDRVSRQRYHPSGNVSWLALGDALGCQRAQQRLTAEYLSDIPARGMVVRLQRMSRVVWVFHDDIVDR